MHSEKVNKTRYDDPRKPIKQTSFRFSTKTLSLDSTIPVDELTVEIFYRFKTSELFNI